MSKSIAVASGKGGVGKTTIAVNLAITLSQKGSKISLMDADFGLANAHIMLGVNPKRSIRDVLKNGLPVEDVIETGPNGIKFISGGSGLIDILNVEKNSMFQLINSINPLEKHTDKLGPPRMRFFSHFFSLLFFFSFFLSNAFGHHSFPSLSLSCLLYHDKIHTLFQTTPRQLCCSLVQ